MGSSQPTQRNTTIIMSTAQHVHSFGIQLTFLILFFCESYTTLLFLPVHFPFWPDNDNLPPLPSRAGGNVHVPLLFLEKKIHIPSSTLEICRRH